MKYQFEGKNCKKHKHMDGDKVELCSLREECSNRFMEQKVERIQHRD